jgi:hypothetical protein
MGEITNLQTMRIDTPERIATTRRGDALGAQDLRTPVMDPRTGDMEYTPDGSDDRLDTTEVNRSSQPEGKPQLSGDLRTGEAPAQGVQVGGDTDGNTDPAQTETQSENVFQQARRGEIVEFRGKPTVLPVESSPDFDLEAARDFEVDRRTVGQVRSDLAKKLPQDVPPRAIAFQLVKAQPKLNQQRFKKQVFGAAEKIAAIINARRKIQALRQVPQQGQTSNFVRAKSDMIQGFQEEGKRALQQLRQMV